MNRLMILFLHPSESEQKYKCALFVDFCEEEGYNGIGNT